LPWLTIEVYKPRGYRELKGHASRQSALPPLGKGETNAKEELGRRCKGKIFWTGKRSARYWRNGRSI